MRPYGADSVLMLWEVWHEGREQCGVDFPDEAYRQPDVDNVLYPDICLRGLSHIVPGLSRCVEETRKRRGKRRATRSGGKDGLAMLCAVCVRVPCAVLCVAVHLMLLVLLVVVVVLLVVLVLVVVVVVVLLLPHILTRLYTSSSSSSSSSGTWGRTLRTWRGRTGRRGVVLPTWHRPAWTAGTTHRRQITCR